MTLDLSYQWEGGREGESSARVISGMEKKEPYYLLIEYTNR